MKRIISLWALVLIMASASAQSIVGKWKSDIIEGLPNDGRGVFEWTFMPDGKAYQTVRIVNKVIDGVDYWITVKAQGFYILEGGKALTFNFDREKTTVKQEIYYDELFLAEKGISGEPLNILKKRLNSNLEPSNPAYQRIEQWCKSVIMPSTLVQILYNDGNKIVYANPRLGFWKTRNELYRIE